MYQEYTANRTKKIISNLDRHNVRKPPSKNTVLFIIAGLVCVVILAIIISRFARSSNTNNTNDDNQPSIQPSVSLMVSPTQSGSNQPTSKPISGEIDSEPLSNTLYLAKKDGRQVLFYSNDLNNIAISSDNEESHDNNLGDVSYGDYETDEKVNYASLASPIRIAELPNEIIFIVDFFVTQDNSQLMVSYVYNDASGLITHNEILVINLESKDQQIGWVRDLFDETYPGFAGAVTIDDVLQNYIQGSVAECFECEGTIDFAKLIINYENNNDLFLEDASNLLFDLEREKVTITKSNGEQETFNLP